MGLNYTHRQVSAILEIIHTELNSDLSVGGLAKRVHVSTSHLAHIFKHVTGKSLERYVKERRMEAAVRMLRGTSLQIKQVAAGVGFANARYFARVFRREKGMSPQSFRKKAEFGHHNLIDEKSGVDYLQ